jgi:putative DNA methylase
LELSDTVVTRKKLIEVALPLDAINEASAREKSIRHGHPSTLHLWWARRPLAAARAVIFAQMVDDPSSYVDTLLGDPITRRAAERELKRRRELWEQRNAQHAAAEHNEAAAVPEPGAEPTLEDAAADIERQRLFRIIQELVKWENTNNETVLEQARAEIWQSWRRACADNADHPRVKELFDRNKLPAFHDPFAGGGALPLEAQRLGLDAYASDLNPVAVLINKAMIEIPPKFAGRPPVNPETRAQKTLAARQWRGAQGLADDVRYYGQWMRNESEKRIGHLYPKIEITADMVKARPDLKPYLGRSLTVIAWLWARTVKSPNPAFRNVDVPLASTFMLFSKAGKEAYVEPIIENGSYRFTVKVGNPKDAEGVKAGTKLSRGANFRCIMSGSPIEGDYIKSEGQAGRMDARLMAIVAEGNRDRIYLSPTPEHEHIARSAQPEWTPDLPISGSTQYLGVKPYGMSNFAQLFTVRHLVSLGTFSDVANEAFEHIRGDATKAGLPDDSRSLRKGGSGATAYAEALMLYLTFAVSKETVFLVTLARWRSGEGKSAPAFGRQAIAMVWDYADLNPFAGAGGDINGIFDGFSRTLENGPGSPCGYAQQLNACIQSLSAAKVISTDPPYYDNVPYADLSDYFYVWLRRAARSVFPDLFTTLSVPKSEELTAFAHNHGGRDQAEAYFLHGMSDAMLRLAQQAHEAFPITIYYAFKQSEHDDNAGVSSTGWETFLDAVINAGFAVNGTWPMRTEGDTRLRGQAANALASSIVLVCRSRAKEAQVIARREFLSALKSELPAALAQLQRGNIAPVDLAQAAIGPGMAIFTRYLKVLDAEGNQLSVRDALALINQVLDEVLAEQEGDFDADSRWAVAWFEQAGFDEGEFGVADVLARAKVTAVSGLANAGIVESGRGKVRLLRPGELSPDWDPEANTDPTIWEVVHHLIRILEADSESAAAALLAKIGSKVDAARELAYRLYAISDRKKRPSDALSYNGLVQAWPEISRLARASAASAGEPVQQSLL